MQVKIFRAANLQAALEEIREQLGPNASVLRTRQCRDGWMGWLGRSYVEVTASADADHDGSSPTVYSSRINITEPDEGSGVYASPARQASGSPGVDTAPLESRSTLPISGYNRPAAAGTNRDPAASSPQAEYRTRLISLGVVPAAADRWIRSTNGFVANLGDRFEQPWQEQTWFDQLQRSVAREIRLSGQIQINPGERRVVALIGPTGVGKTTTIAKLAAGFRIQSKRRVGLLTIDTFRIAAVQQLQAYAQIMDLPMSVVESADQMRGAIDRLGDVDLILIDTAGRSPRGDMKIEGLADLLRSAQPDETHLVISATSTAAVIQSALEGFAAARPTSAILTKLDEAPYTAGVLSALTSSHDFMGVPVSYMTNGQHVPEDITIASADQLVSRLLPAPIVMPQIEAA
ncbi:flagellar biosynthesis protein FlhF [Stieleria sp. TO1_6]|uniref:flagellar biosynthesis protein FlhF n=1 Tax=Stieleria tagensis TaxID=2956795 RepID=UPI00209AA75B|nr:flagellar biosynthesis protein FlhF [Stieleria tagensis]MCO8123826.1 flagellar biosynthesis protein FlhF [Stieleria tagensis]